MGYLHWLEFEVRLVVRENRFWMAWNLVLAAIPAGLAWLLFRPRARWGRPWWVGVAAFALFLPNAPYVVSDLKWLHPAVTDAASRGVVVAGVLPLFATYVAIGLFFYWWAVQAVVGEALRRRPRLRAGWLVAGIHLFCAVGVVLGRIGRVNSWGVVTSPAATAGNSVQALAGLVALRDLAIAMVAIALGYAAMSVAVRGAESLASTMGALARRDRQPHPSGSSTAA